MNNIKGPWQWRGRHLIDGTGRTVLKLEPSNAMPDELAAIAAVPEVLILLHNLALSAFNSKTTYEMALAIHQRIESATWLPPVDAPPAAK